MAPGLCTYWTVPAERLFYLAGKPAQTAESLDVLTPFDGSVISRTWLAGDAEFETAAAAAIAAAPVMRRMPAYQRSAILSAAWREIERRKDEIAKTLAGEAGKPIKDARVEHDRRDDGTTAAGHSPPQL